MVVATNCEVLDSEQYPAPPALPHHGLCGTNATWQYYTYIMLSTLRWASLVLISLLLNPMVGSEMYIRA